MQRNDVYDGQFRANVLIAGKPGCGKTHFMQKLAINNFFGKIVKTEWVLSIQLTLTRKVEIQASFSCDVTFHYPQTHDRLDDIIEDFKLKTIDDTDSIDESEYGQNKRNERLMLLTTSLVWPIDQIHFRIFLQSLENSVITACIYFKLFYQKKKSG